MKCVAREEVCRGKAALGQRNVPVGQEEEQAVLPHRQAPSYQPQESKKVLSAETTLCLGACLSSPWCPGSGEVSPGGRGCG